MLYMNYKDKYIRDKIKYLDIKYIQLNNQFGSGFFDINYINNMIEDMKNKSHNKNIIIACVLKKIMDEFKITNKQYMVIAGYCLHKYKNVGDLDVVVEKGIPYDKLRNSGLFAIDSAKISGDERLVLKLPNIDDEAEIEFFPKMRNVGFPSNYYSLENLQSKKLLTRDNYGNPYFNEITCAKQYSDIKIGSDSKYYMCKFEIPKKRVEKNISHLKFILNNTLDRKTKKYCKKKIILLENLITSFGNKDDSNDINNSAKHY